jgi:hypothetical protein
MKLLPNKRKLAGSTWLPVAQINIENQFNKCTELQHTVANLDTQPLIIAIVETWESIQ